MIQFKKQQMKSAYIGKRMLAKMQNYNPCNLTTSPKCVIFERKYLFQVSTWNLKITRKKQVEPTCYSLDFQPLLGRVPSLKLTYCSPWKYISPFSKNRKKWILRFATFFLRGKLTVTTQTNYINDNKQKPDHFHEGCNASPNLKTDQWIGVFVSHKSPGFMCDRGSLEGLFIPDREGGHQPPTFWKDLTGKFTIIPKKAHLFLATELPGISELVPTSFVNQLLNFESIHPPGGLFYLKFVPALLTNSWTLNLCLPPRCFSIGEIDAYRHLQPGICQKIPRLSMHFWW